MAVEPTHKPIQGLACGILAGGGSRRMGRDKAWLELDSEPMLARIARALAAAGELFVAVGHEHRALPPLAVAAELVTDPVADQGPVAGIVAIAAALPARVTRLFACGCDLPFVTPDVIELLDERWQGSDADAVVPEIEGRLEPLVAVYGRASLARFTSDFRAGRRRLTDVVESLEPERIGDHELRRVDPELTAFVNLNRPEDYARAVTLLGRSKRLE